MIRSTTMAAIAMMRERRDERGRWIRGGILTSGEKRSSRARRARVGRGLRQQSWPSKTPRIEQPDEPPDDDWVLPQVPSSLSMALQVGVGVGDALGVGDGEWVGAGFGLVVGREVGSEVGLPPPPPLGPAEDGGAVPRRIASSTAGNKARRSSPRSLAISPQVASWANSATISAK